MKNNTDKYWELLPCSSGSECWCRMVVNENYKTSKDEDDIIIGSACLSKSEANYFVSLHNNRLRSGKVRKGVPLTEDDIKSLYGDRLWEVGTYLKDGTNYYKQNENNVLHLNVNVINHLPKSALNSKSIDLEPISEDEFYTELDRIKTLLEI